MHCPPVRRICVLPNGLEWRLAWCPQLGAPAFPRIINIPVQLQPAMAWSASGVVPASPGFSSVQVQFQRIFYADGAGIVAACYGCEPPPGWAPAPCGHMRGFGREGMAVCSDCGAEVVGPVRAAIQELA